MLSHRQIGYKWCSINLVYTFKSVRGVCLVSSLFIEHPIIEIVCKVKKKSREGGMIAAKILKMQVKSFEVVVRYYKKDSWLTLNQESFLFVNKTSFVSFSSISL